MTSSCDGSVGFATSLEYTFPFWRRMVTGMWNAASKPGDHSGWKITFTLARASRYRWLDTLESVRAGNHTSLSSIAAPSTPSKLNLASCPLVGSEYCIMDLVALFT